MRHVAHEDSPPGDPLAIRAAQRNFLFALFQLKPSVGDVLTQRLEKIPPRAQTQQRVGQEIASWARETGLPHDLAIEGISGFDLFLSPPERGDEGWGGLIAYKWLQEQWSYDDNRFYEAIGDGIDIRSGGATEDTGVLPSETGPFEFRHDGGSRRHGTLRDLGTDIQASFNHELKRWLKTLRLRARAEGFERESQKRRRAGGITRDPTLVDQERRRHFVWLARFQCLRHTQATIAKDFGVEAQTVGDAVRETARQARIPLRTGTQRGRPRKPKVLPK